MFSSVASSALSAQLVSKVSSNVLSSSNQPVPLATALHNAEPESDAMSDVEMIDADVPLLVVQNMTYIVNVTADVPIEYAMVMFGYIMPYLLIITLIANTLIVIVLSQKHMTSPTNLVLLAMAISDALTLCFPAPWYFYLYSLSYHSRRLLYPPSICYAYHLSIEVIPAFLHTASIWLTLLLATQRYIYVCHPTLARTWCTVPGVKKSILLVFILAFLHQSTRFVDRSFSPVRFEWQGSMKYACRFDTASWVHQLVTEDLYFISYYGFRIIFVHAGPCTVLVVLNLLLFRALRKAQKNREALFKHNLKCNESRKARDSYGTTLMLIVIVTVFLATEIPLAVCTVLHVAQNALNINIANYETLNLTVLFSNFVILLSYPVNFAIYCGMSTQFRQTFNSIFCKGRFEPSVTATTVAEGCESPESRRITTATIATAATCTATNSTTTSTTTTTTTATTTAASSGATRTSVINGPKACSIETNL